MNPDLFQAGVDQMLRDFLAEDRPAASGRGKFGWLREHFEEPTVVILPLYRMRRLPAPFTISEQDRSSRRSNA